MVRSVRIGISGFVVALIVSGVWFVVTDQAAEISRQARYAKTEYVLSQRAVTRGGSVEAMKRLAYKACLPSYWFEGTGGITGDDCVTNYLYGDELMEPMPSIFIWQWVWAVAQVIAYCALAGLALTAASEMGPRGFKVWWSWLAK
jgi:hypothetical protein